MTQMLFQVEILKRDVNQAQAQLEKFQEGYEIMEELYLSNLEAQTSTSGKSSMSHSRKSASPSPNPSPAQSPSPEQQSTSKASCRRSLADVLAIQEEIAEILKENSDLIGQFESLTQTISNGDNSLQS
jgi:hypothetical protein